MDKHNQPAPKLTLDSPLTESVIGAAMEVSTILGPGFLEGVYERALLLELASRSIPAEPQHQLPIHYKGQLIAEFVPDILVNREIIVELKCVDHIAEIHIAQCLNYLRAPAYASPFY